MVRSFTCKPYMYIIGSVSKTCPRVFLDFTGDSCAQKSKQITDKAIKHNSSRVQCFLVFGLSYACINRSGVHFVFLFIFSLLYFPTNCTNFPFSPTLCFGALHLCYGLPPLHFDPIRLLCRYLTLCFNCAAYVVMQSSSLVARISALTHAASVAACLSSSILATSALYNRSVSDLLLTIALALAASSLAALLCASTQMATFWALILSL